MGREETMNIKERDPIPHPILRTEDTEYGLMSTEAMGGDGRPHALRSQRGKPLTTTLTSSEIPCTATSQKVRVRRK